MNVIFTVDEKSCLEYLGRSISLPANAQYFSFDDLASKTEKLLTAKGFAVISADLHLVTPAETVLKHYVRLVGEVNARMHSPLWWATDFSSKNRFNSQLPDILYKFLIIIELLKLSQGRQILIIGLPWQARATMARTLSQLGVAYEFIGYAEAAGKARRKAFFKKITNLTFHFLRLLYRRFYVKYKLKAVWPTPYSKDKPCYMIKSFLYDHSFDKEGNYKDAFFGPLPTFLKDSQNVVFFVNILGNLKSCVAKITQNTQERIIPLEACSSVLDLVKAYLRALFYTPRLHGQYSFLNHEVTEIIRNELVYSGKIQLYQLAHYYQTKKLLGKLSPTVFLTTYENNPWEKMCFLALRKFSPQTEIIGYQHTVTPQASVNMFMSSEEERNIPKPDLVLTVGEIPQETIIRYSEAASLPVEPACALRFEQLWSLKPAGRSQTQTILLGLEGIFDVYKMVNYVVEQLIGQPEVKLLIRTHPVLPLKDFAHKLQYRLKDLKFVEISKGRTLIQDIERSDMTIYWGSTVALESLWMGKPVIHFDMETLLSYDPLFDCPYLKRTVNRRQKLIDVIHEIYKLSDLEFHREAIRAKEYLQRHFYPISPRNMARFLPGK